MIRIIPLDFLGQGALLEPANPKLHDAAVAYAYKELAEGKDINFSRFAKVWVGLKDDEVMGICGYVLKADIPLFRATDEEVLMAMGHRLNNFLADHGALGQEALIYIGNEKPEARCPNYKKALREFGAVSGRRFSITVK